jgi:hypothetical protein
VVADAAAAVGLGVGVEALVPHARRGHADAVADAHLGGGVEHAEHGAARAVAAQEGQHAVVAVVGLHPTKSLGVVVSFVQRGLARGRGR